MRMNSYIPMVLAAAATGASIAVATAATASDQTCASVGLSETECQTPGNVQINDSPPVQNLPQTPYLGGYRYSAGSVLTTTDGTTTIGRRVDSRSGAPPLA